MLTVKDLHLVWLYASALPTAQASATITVRFPRSNASAQISLARQIEPFGQFASPESTSITPYGHLNAYILRWSKFDDQGFGSFGFRFGEEPSVLNMPNAVDITFQLDAIRFTGVATASIFLFE